MPKTAPDIKYDKRLRALFKEYILHYGTLGASHIVEILAETCEQRVRDLTLDTGPVDGGNSQLFHDLSLVLRKVVDNW